MGIKGIFFDAAGVLYQRATPTETSRPSFLYSFLSVYERIPVMKQLNCRKS